MVAVPKRVDQLAAEKYKEILLRDRQESIDRARQIDRIVIWLVGLSTGGIALLVSQLDKMKQFDSCVLKLTTLCLLLSIIAGITYRIIYYYYETMASMLLYSLEGKLISYIEPSYGPRELPQSSTPEQIAESLKKDMGFDFDALLDHKYPQHIGHNYIA